MKAGLLGAAAAVALAVPTGAQGAVIDDPAGDANATGTAGLSVVTAPVSDASRDLVRVTVDRVTDGIVVRFGLSAPPDLGGPTSFAILRANRGACNVSLAAMWGGGGPIAVSDLDDCDEEFLGIGAPGYSSWVEGSTVVAYYPYAALAGNFMGIGPSTTLRALRAETRVGTFGSAGGFTSCHPDCEEEGFHWAQSGFVGPIIDSTETTGTLAALPRKARARRR